MHQKILILDFSSQYTQLITHRVRETNIYYKLHPHNINDEFIHTFNPQNIILSNEPTSIYEKKTPHTPNTMFTLDIPILSIYYNIQTMTTQLS